VRYDDFDRAMNNDRRVRKQAANVFWFIRARRCFLRTVSRLSRTNKPVLSLSVSVLSLAAGRAVKALTVRSGDLTVVVPRSGWTAFTLPNLRVAAEEGCKQDKQVVNRDGGYVQ
jgi:hypothetical protein